MIYTSYFAKLKSLPESVVPISICAKAPAWYTGLQYKRVIPKYDFFMKWKENHDNEYFIRCFKEQVLRDLNATEIVSELSRLCSEFGRGEKDIALLCYERPTDFCHRHLVASWLNENGFECTEYPFGR